MAAPFMRVLRYLVACAAAGAIVGRAFGEFARARFHYPLRLEDVSPWHRTLLRVLEVVEWPSLFGLTLATSVVLWVLLKPRPAAGFWREAFDGARSARARWLSQLPWAAGHLAATCAAALSLGYRGESALIHGFALLTGFGLFVLEVVVAALIAIVPQRR
jgi:hypothetical protein